MPRKALQPDGLAVPKPPYSPVVVSGDTVYVEFFDGPHPARTSVQAGLPAGVLIEIEAVARRT